MLQKLSASLLVLMFAGALALQPGITHAQSAQYEQSLQTVQFQLINAIYANDQLQTNALFQVLLDLIALGDNNFVGNGFGNSGVLSLSTERATDIEEEEVELNGEINFSGQSDRAYVWFQYGEDEDELNFETSREFIDEDDDKDFSVTIEDLDEDEKYYFRAIAEDRDTKKLFYGEVRSFTTDDDNRRSSRDDEPDVDTREADDIKNNRAEINGRVDMNDFRNGEVFFVWGEDEGVVEDVEDEDEYRDVDEDGDDLQKQRVDSDLDGTRSYSLDIRNLDRNTDIFYTICVAYEDEDNDEVIDCGDVEEFETKN